MSYRRLFIALLSAITLSASIAALAQVAQSSQLGQEPGPRPRIWVGGDGGYGRYYSREAPKWATREDFDGRFNFCRGYYSSDRPEAGGQGWRTDYPGADNNFSVRLGELSFVRVKMKSDGQPDNVVIRLNDPLLYRCPFLYMEDVGTARFSDDEVANLRAYLLKGGFLEVDDFWGSRAWDQWVQEISRVLPPGEYPIFDIPAEHPVLHSLYDVKDVEQVSNIRFWAQTGSVSERGSDSPHANFRGIQDQKGRLMVVMAHNTDIPDTWEREGESQEYFDRFSPNGYALGVNIMIYAMTH
jgi:hypothetical protein